MKITKIETFKFWASWCNWLFVKVQTDEGLVGWGEASLHGPIASTETAIHELGTTLIGEDPSGIERHWQRMYSAWRWRGGPVISSALAALDIALWDIEGKRLGVPVYRLLGGPHRDKLRVYASHWLPDVKTPDEAYQGARNVVERGFTAFKWNPFDYHLLRENENHAIDLATEMMAAARDGAGDDVDIFIECSEQLSPRIAPRAAEALKPYHPGWFEEPIPFENPQEMARLREKLCVPIACGERLLSRWEYAPILNDGACDIVQPDVMHAKGITELRKIAALADMYYVPVAPHNPGGPICTLASMHVAASIPNFYILEQMEAERELRDSISSNPVKYANGHFELPNQPGLGTELIFQSLNGKEYKPQPVSNRTESIWW